MPILHLRKFPLGVNYNFSTRLASLACQRKPDKYIAFTKCYSEANYCDILEWKCGTPLPPVISLGLLPLTKVHEDILKISGHNMEQSKNQHGPYCMREDRPNYKLSQSKWPTGKTASLFDIKYSVFPPSGCGIKMYNGVKESGLSDPLTVQSGTFFHSKRYTYISNPHPKDSLSGIDIISSEETIPKLSNRRQYFHSNGNDWTSGSPPKGESGLRSPTVNVEGDKGNPSSSSTDFISLPPGAKAKISGMFLALGTGVGFFTSYYLTDTFDDNKDKAVSGKKYHPDGKSQKQKKTVSDYNKYDEVMTAPVSALGSLFLDPNDQKNNSNSAKSGHTENEKRKQNAQGSSGTPPSKLKKSTSLTIVGEKSEQIKFPGDAEIFHEQKMLKTVFGFMTGFLAGAGACIVIRSQD